MEIVNIEAETFREMLSAWNSLKSKLEELQDVCLKKSIRRMARMSGSLRDTWHILPHPAIYEKQRHAYLYPDRRKSSLPQAGYRVIIENRTKEKINYGKDYYPDK